MQCLRSENAELGQWRMAQVHLHHTLTAICFPIATDTCHEMFAVWVP